MSVETLRKDFEILDDLEQLAEEIEEEEFEAVLAKFRPKTQWLFLSVCADALRRRDARKEIVGRAWGRA